MTSKFFNFLMSTNKYDKEETIKMAVQKDGKEYNFAKKGMVNLENGLFDIGSESTEEK